MFADPSESSHAEQDPFFIVGTGRCGSTMLQDLLSEHPRLHVAPETHFFTGCDPTRRGVPWTEASVDEYVTKRLRMGAGDWLPPIADALRREAQSRDRDTRAMFLALVGLLAERAGKPRIGEKTPGHFWAIPRLRRLFPAARFIHLYRDPRSVAASMLRMPWTHDLVWRHARSWRRIMHRDAGYRRELGDAYLSVRYEDLVTDPQEHMRAMCTFLGEAYEPAVLQQSEAPHTKTVDRWRRDLSPRQVHTVEDVTGPWLARMGYERSLGPRPRWAVADRLDRCRHWVTKQSASVARRIVP